MEDQLRRNSRNENKLDADGLADLPVVDSEANETKGGEQDGQIDLQSWSMNPPASSTLGVRPVKIVVDPRL